MKSHIMTTLEESRAVVASEKKNSSHLTRRGKAALTLAGLGLAAGAFGIAEHIGDEKESQLKVPSVTQEHKVVVLDEGQTVWNLAHKAYPNRDPREVTPMLTAQIPEEFHGVAQMHEQFMLPADAQIGELVPAQQQGPDSGQNK